MKTLYKSLLIFTFIFAQNLSAQTITKETFKVKGDCGMCKDRIETTAKETGATYANWTKETQELIIEFDSSKISTDEILRKIAAVGHDNERFTAPNDVYEKLAACCHYERQPSFLKSENEKYQFKRIIKSSLL